MIMGESKPSIHLPLLAVVWTNAPYKRTISKGKDRLPTIIFQGDMLVFQGVIIDSAKKSTSMKDKKGEELNSDW